MILRDNAFVERVLPGSSIRQLSSAEMDHYRRPFVNPGEDRRPTLTWPRQIPLDGEPADVAKIVSDYSQWLAQSQVPKLYCHTEPGALDQGRSREFCRTWSNQTEVIVKGIHFVQEDSPVETARPWPISCGPFAADSRASRKLTPSAGISAGYAVLLTASNTDVHSI